MQAEKALADARASKNDNNNAVAVAPTGAGNWPQTCSGVKLEFLRWSKDANGNKLSCPFNPENYENWKKMPPLCDYISIECLGEENLRSAHVFGFGAC